MTAAQFSSEVWGNPDAWPPDARGGDFVFLARAFHEVGQCRFLNAWTGQEPFAVAVENREEDPRWLDSCLAMISTDPTSPDHGAVKAMLRDEAEWNARVKVWTAARFGSGNASELDPGPRPLVPHDQKLQCVRARIAQLNDVVGPALARRGWVMETIRDLCARHDASAVRADQIVPLDREWWDAPDWPKAFATCSTRWLAPTIFDVGRTVQASIFLSRHDLDILKESISRECLRRNALLDAVEADLAQRLSDWLGAGKNTALIPVYEPWSAAIFDQHPSLTSGAVKAIWEQLTATHEETGLPGRRAKAAITRSAKLGAALAATRQTGA